MKKSLLIISLLFVFVFLFTACKEDEIITNSTVTTEETVDEVPESQTSNDNEEKTESKKAEEKTESNTTESDIKSNNKVKKETPVTQSVDLSDRNVIVGKWKALTKTIDGVSSAPEHTYLIITDDFKFYPSDSLTSLSGNYTYEYNNGKLIVSQGSTLYCEYTVSMKSEDDITLTYISDGKNIVETYEKTE